MAPRDGAARRRRATVHADGGGGDRSDSDDGSAPRPLVLLPGAGAGLTSFVPFVLFLQRRYRRIGEERTMVVYRLPWVEVGRPWSHLPQWDAVVNDMGEGLSQLLGPHAAFDVVAHSYGTAVVNRFLRSLCHGLNPLSSSPACAAALWRTTRGAN